MYCSPLVIMNGQVKLTNGWNKGSMASFSCDENYYWKGMTRESICQEGGQWSDQTGRCSKSPYQYNVNAITTKILIMLLL